MTTEQPTRKIVRALKDAGFTPLRTKGSHTMWANGSVQVSVPDGHRTISPAVVRKVEQAISEARKAQN